MITKDFLFILRIRNKTKLDYHQVLFMTLSQKHIHQRLLPSTYYHHHKHCILSELFPLIYLK
jgi:hypothetical protein